MCTISLAAVENTNVYEAVQDNKITDVGCFEVRPSVFEVEVQ